MSLSIALNSALSGLNVNQQQLSILSQNIANANTPGYSRQIGSQAAVFVNGRGNGVNITEVARKVDEYLVNAVQRQNSNLSSASVVDDYNSRLQLLIGNPGSQNSIDSYINTYFNSLQSLVQTPQNTTLQQSVINNGVTLAENISGLATEVRDLQFQADQDIKAAIDDVNRNLRRLDELNRLVTSNVSLGKSVADLEDQRDEVIKSIGEMINVSTIRQTNGALSLTTGSGVTILDTTLYQLSYTPLSSSVSFSDGSSVGPITVFRVNENLERISSEVVLATSAPPTQVSSVFSTGRVAGLMQMRDKDLPNIMAQLDTMSSSLRDNINAIHNTGAGYPGSYLMTGTREVFGNQIDQWAGQVRIAVLDNTGQPVQSPYSDEPNGIKPLTIDLEKLDTLSGAGNPSVQGIIDAINNYYGTPQKKMELGVLNNIQVVSNQTNLPSSPPKFNFDFNLNNISSESGSFFVTNVTVKDNNGVDITSVTDSMPSFNLSGGNTYVTSAGSSTVTINTDGSHGLSEGQVVYLSTPPGGPYDGIPASDLGGYFKISNVTGNSFTISVATPAGSGATIGVANQTGRPPYAEANAGVDTRTQGKGTISADLTANSASPYYTVSVSMGVADNEGNVTSSIVSYRITNNQSSILNKVIGAEDKTGGGQIVSPTILAPLMTAKLVDENGVELTKIGGAYVTDRPGFLQLRGGTTDYYIAIDSLNSQEMGNPTVSPIIPGSNRAFSHYFELNNFFESNQPTNTGDTIAGSALNFKVEQRLRDNPGLLSLGTLNKKADPADPTLPPNYTYQMNPGDNSVVTKLSALSSKTINFIAAGGLGATLNTFSGYTAQVIGAISTNAATATNNKTTAQALLDGFSESAASISGVNLDVELANTVIYQNAYTASARVITVTSELFDTLLNIF